MQVVFDTKTLAAAQRRQAWRDAICEIYLQVDCDAEKQYDYVGFVREARLGTVTLTDTFCSPQSIRRQSHHIAHFDKDYYYLGIEHLGMLGIHQAGSSLLLRPGIAGLYYANEPYELRCDVNSRQFWVELPRQAFDRRFESGRPPLLTQFDLNRGLGRIAAEFCATLAEEGVNVDDPSREKLGEHFMDILALALSGEPDRQPADETSVQLARLRSVKAYIEANLGDFEFVPGHDSQAERHFAALSSSTVPTDGHVGFGMVAAQAIATMPRSTDIAAKRQPLDHGNCVFHGFHQFVPFQ